jgi:hypothetical protein
MHSDKTSNKAVGQMERTCSWLYKLSKTKSAYEIGAET